MFTNLHGRLDAVCAHAEGPRVVGHALHQTPHGQAELTEQIVAVIRGVVLSPLLFGEKSGRFEVDVVTGVLHPSLGEHVVCVHVEVPGSVQLGDEGELAELLG